MNKYPRGKDLKKLIRDTRLILQEKAMRKISGQETISRLHHSVNVFDPQLNITTDLFT